MFLQPTTEHEQAFAVSEHIDSLMDQLKDLTGAEQLRLAYQPHDRDYALYDPTRIHDRVSPWLSAPDMAFYLEAMVESAEITLSEIKHRAPWK